ncbi:MAG: DegT/DnrJ/EryC1/StrS family aminotransferase [Thermodesulfobacteriota bacterium]
MTALRSRIILLTAHNAVAERFGAWVKAHRIGLNAAVHCLLFGLSYSFSLFMLEELFLPGEAKSLLARTLPFLVLVRLAVFWYHDLYEGVWVYVSFADAVNIIRASGISTLAFALLGIFLEPLRLQDKLLLLDTFFCIMTVYGVRLAARTVHEKLLVRSSAYQGQEILLVGPLKRVQTLAGEMLSDPLTYYKPAALVDISDGRKDLRLRISDVPVLSIEEAVSRRDRFHKVRYLVLCWPHAAQEELDRLVQDLKPLGIPFTTLPYLDELLPPEPEISADPQARGEPVSEKSEAREPEGHPKIRKRIFLSPPHMSGLEQEYVRRAFRSNYIAPLGPMVDAFEQEFSEMTGIPHAVALSSGTSAIHLVLKAMGIGAGDTVMASSLTFIGSVTPILFQGAMPVFVDCDRRTWNMDPGLLADGLRDCAKSGRFPKAVLPTDLYGQCSDYHALSKICETHGIPLIVDAAEAMGATYNGGHAGSGVTAAVFSFNGNKIITTSGGGMLASGDKALVDQARFLSQQARDPFPHYEHTRIGYNYRMSNILAGIGLAQLKVLEERVRRKREIFDHYHSRLGDTPGIEFMPEAPYGRSNRWLTVILISPEKFGADRETVRLALEGENIEARPVWKPMHLQPVFKLKAEGSKLKGKEEGRYEAMMVGGEVSEDLFRRGLCLPSGTTMNREDLDRVIEVILGCRR